MYCQRVRPEGVNANDGAADDVTWVVRENISSQRETEDVAGLFGLIDPDEPDRPAREQMTLDSGADSTT